MSYFINKADAETALPDARKKMAFGGEIFKVVEKQYGVIGFEIEMYSQYTGQHLATYD